jgi:hypothetical protein
LTIKNQLDEDFNKFNLDVEQIRDKEISRLNEEINALKEKASKMGEELSSPSCNTKKGS